MSFEVSYFKISFQKILENARSLRNKENGSRQPLKVSQNQVFFGIQKSVIFPLSLTHFLQRFGRLPKDFRNQVFGMFSIISDILCSSSSEFFGQPSESPIRESSDWIRLKAFSQMLSKFYLSTTKRRKELLTQIVPNTPCC